MDGFFGVSSNKGTRKRYWKKEMCAPPQHSPAGRGSAVAGSAARSQPGRGDAGCRPPRSPLGPCRTASPQWEFIILWTWTAFAKTPADCSESGSGLCRAPPPGKHGHRRGREGGRGAGNFGDRGREKAGFGLGYLFIYFFILFCFPPSEMNSRLICMSRSCFE